jgi:dolichyl-phosphate mannosyltransferase polypeptide 3
MTKLVEWLTLGTTFLAVWLTLLRGNVIEITADMKIHVILLPVYLVALFGAISAGIVLYRTATFNDCPEAAEELRAQIKEARADLAKRGFKAPVISSKSD